jgi:hypothetical protein
LIVIALSTASTCRVSFLEPRLAALYRNSRDDDARQHIRLAHIGDVIGHGSLRLAHKMGEDVRIEQIQTLSELNGFRPRARNRREFLVERLELGEHAEQ